MEAVSARASIQRIAPPSNGSRPVTWTQIMRPVDGASGSRGVHRTSAVSKSSSSTATTSICNSSMVVKVEPASASTSPLGELIPSTDSSVNGNQLIHAAKGGDPSGAPDGCSSKKIGVKSRSFSASGGVSAAGSDQHQGLQIGRSSALPPSLNGPSSSGGAATKCKISSKDFQKIVLKSLGDGSVAKVNALLEKINNLNDGEKALLYSRLPDGLPGDEDPLKACVNPLGSRFEIAQTLAWIRTHLVEDPEVSLPKQEVYDDYMDFCNRNQLKALSTADFGKAMKQVFPLVKPRRLGVRGQSRYCYSGLRKKVGMAIPSLPDLSRPNGAVVKTEEDHEKDREDAAMVLGWASKILNRRFNAVPELANHLRRSGVVVAVTSSQVVSHGQRSVVIARSHSSNGQTQVQTQPHIQVQTSAGRKAAALARSQSTSSTPVCELTHGRSIGGPNVDVTVTRRTSSSSLGFGVLGSVKEGDLIFGQQNGFLLAASTAPETSSSPRSAFQVTNVGVAAEQEAQIQVHSAVVSPRVVSRTFPDVVSQQTEPIQRLASPPFLSLKQGCSVVKQTATNKLPIPRLRPVEDLINCPSRSCSTSPQTSFIVRYQPVQSKSDDSSNYAATPAASVLPSNSSLMNGSKRPGESPVDQPDKKGLRMASSSDANEESEGFAELLNANHCTSSFQLHDDFSSVFNNQNLGGSSPGISHSFAQFDSDSSRADSGTSAVESEKKVFSLMEEESVGEGDMTRSQLRQLLEPAVASRPVLASSSSAVVAPPVMLVHGSTITPMKRRVSFLNQPGMATSGTHISFAAPSASCPASSGVPLSPGARSRAFFTPISPHGSQPSSAVHSPFISPRSTPTASLMRSRNNSGQLRSRHPSLKTVVVVPDSSDDVFLSPSSSTRAPRSRHNSGNQVVQQQLAITGVDDGSKKIALQLPLSKLLPGSQSGLCPTTVSAAGNEFLRRRHQSAMASSSSARFQLTPQFIQLQQAPQQRSKQEQVFPQSSLNEGDSLRASLVESLSWLDGERARSVPVPAEDACGGNYSGQLSRDPLLSAGSVGSGDSCNNIYSSEPGTPMGAEIALINSGVMNESNSGGAHDNFHQSQANEATSYSLSDILASSAVSSNAPSVDSGFVDGINLGLSHVQCPSSNGGGNIQYKANEASKILSASSNVQITSRSYPNTPFPDENQSVFWSAGPSQFRSDTNQQIQEQAQASQYDAHNSSFSSHSYPSTPSKFDHSESKFFFDNSAPACSSEANSGDGMDGSDPVERERQAFSPELAPIDDDVINYYMADLKDDCDASVLNF